MQTNFMLCLVKHRFCGILLCSHNGSQQIGFTFSHKKLNKNKKVAFSWCLYNVKCGYMVWVKHRDPHKIRRRIPFPINRPIHTTHKIHWMVSAATTFNRNNNEIYRLATLFYFDGQCCCIRWVQILILQKWMKIWIKDWSSASNVLV